MDILSGWAPWRQPSATPASGSGGLLTDAGKQTQALAAVERALRIPEGEFG